MFNNKYTCSECFPTIFRMCDKDTCEMISYQELSQQYAVNKQCKEDLVAQLEKIKQALGEVEQDMHQQEYILNGFFIRNRDMATRFQQNRNKLLANNKIIYEASEQQKIIQKEDLAQLLIQKVENKTFILPDDKQYQVILEKVEQSLKDVRADITTPTYGDFVYIRSFTTYFRLKIDEKQEPVTSLIQIETQDVDIIATQPGEIVDLCFQDDRYLYFYALEEKDIEHKLEQFLLKKQNISKEREKFTVFCIFFYPEIYNKLIIKYKSMLSNKWANGTAKCQMISYMHYQKVCLYLKICIQKIKDMRNKKISSVQPDDQISIFRYFSQFTKDKDRYQNKIQTLKYLTKDQYSSFQHMQEQFQNYRKNSRISNKSLLMVDSQQIFDKKDKQNQKQKNKVDEQDNSLDLQQESQINVKNENQEIEIELEEEEIDNEDGEEEEICLSDSEIDEQ